MTQDTERLIKLVNKGIEVFHKANPNNKRDYVGNVFIVGERVYYGLNNNPAAANEVDVIDLAHMVATLSYYLIDVCDLYLEGK